MICDYGYGQPITTIEPKPKQTREEVNSFLCLRCFYNYQIYNKNTADLD